MLEMKNRTIQATVAAHRILPQKLRTAQRIAIPSFGPPPAESRHHFRKQGISEQLLKESNTSDGRNETK